MPRLRDDGARWSPVGRGLHWAMAALILFQLGLGVSMVRQDDVLVRFAWTQLHKSFGTFAFALVLARILWRLTGPARPALPGPRWQARVVRLVHALLYVAMVVMPVSGWVMAAAAPTQDLLGLENRVFGGPALPDPWVPGDACVEAVARAVHVGAACGLVLVLAVHVGAAIWHHFVLRDRTLVAMVRGR